MYELDSLIDSYLEAIAVEGKTEATIRSYKNSLEHFRKVGRELGLPDLVDEYRTEHVYQFLGALRERGASATFRHRRQREIRAFFSWCRRMGFVEKSVFAQVPLVKLEHKIREPLSHAEVQKLLDAQTLTTYAGCRNYAIILFLLDTGVRAGECIGIDLSDVDLSAGHVLVRHGKGQKQRVVAFGEQTGEALVHYLRVFRGNAPGALFLTSTHRRLASPSALHQIIARLGDAAGVPHVYPHRFRHTFATWAIEAGAREIDVQLLLGHTSLTMTQRYARSYTSAQAVRAHARMSPVRQLLPQATDQGTPEVGPPATVNPAPRCSANLAGRGWRDELRPGMILRGEHRGTSVTCTVIERNGDLAYELENGVVARSISAAARKVTGTQVNGYRFWSPIEIAGTPVDSPRDRDHVGRPALSLPRAVR